MTTVLALDLSLNSTGYAVIQWNEGKATVIELGHIDNKKQGRMKRSHGKKLARIFSELKAVINRYPDINVIVREKGITRFNKATQALFRVVGCVDLLIESTGHEPVQELSISEVKKLITGNGKADKTEVAQLVEGYLTNPVNFENDDESDAVAVGVSYCLKEEL